MFLMLLALYIKGRDEVKKMLMFCESINAPLCQSLTQKK